MPYNEEERIIYLQQREAEIKRSMENNYYYQKYDSVGGINKNIQ